MKQLQDVGVKIPSFAVFSAYFAWAKRENMNVETKLNISDRLPGCAAKLSIAFANVPDNTSKACSVRPEEQRRIVCKCVDRPWLMPQVKNPYTEEVHFDSKGLPIDAEKGHGIGTRSIVVFCKKHDAVCDYQVKDEWSQLRISL